jgi:FkbM family methyltransferase
MRFGIKKIIKSIIPASFIEFAKHKREQLFNKKQKDQRRLFYSSFIEKNDIVFDIGANMGNRVEAFVAIGAKVIALEPQRKCVGYLNKRFAGDDVKVIAKGVGSKEEIKDFFVSDVSTLSTFSEDWMNTVKESRFKDHQWNKVEQIQITTLDALINEYGKPKFIKIDVEGFEAEVLKGLTNTIDYICFEYAVPEFKSRLIECMNVLNNISNAVVFNFMAGEEMQFKLDEWISYREMLSMIDSNKFQSANYGDIYARFKLMC